MLNFLKKKEGIILVSILWGFGLACLFRQVCKSRKCIIYNSPDPNKFIDKIYNFNNKCYTYNIENIKC